MVLKTQSLITLLKTHRSDPSFGCDGDSSQHEQQPTLYIVLLCVSHLGQLVNLTGMRALPAQQQAAEDKCTPW
jgi:hypothetical protein